MKEVCPRFESAMSMLGRRWTGLIIYQLLQGPQRFCTIESALGISGRLLSSRLKELEENGLVDRTVYPETPVRIIYELTDQGEELEPVMRALETWSERWMTSSSC
ncbi:winged helix-turn-helix transcriptional regulator [Alkalicoccus chagannorensis]|uniref:winged helix-turn-helix transcriptional regulator n=1 Tax=Alkalicoccus chagannorensis TaxID=427072 RepID=UPI000412DD46|nr:helix-turn-helix domain-containing protein [Alkalicoccus chagannorensis]